MIPVAEAEAIALSCAHPLDAERERETVPLAEAGDRILAQAVRSDRDFPDWDNAAMDGYAARSDDLAAASVARPVALDVVAEIPAGRLPATALQPGQAARIFTGAMLPEGADTVIPQEDAVRDGSRVQMATASPPGQFVRRRGAFYQAGQPLLAAGLRLGPADVAVLAVAQCTEVQVFRRLRVAILSTGSELVAPGQALQPGQIADSNQYALAAWVRRCGAIAQPLGIVPDEPEQLRGAIARAVETADIVLSTGGVSVGDYDFIDQTLQDLGGQIHLRQVAIKPGKPLTVATFARSLGSCLYFGLPGNPASALVTCYRFVQPALRKRSGLAGPWGPTFVRARSRQALRADGKRETYLWGQLEANDGHYEFALAPGAGNSGNPISLAQVTGFAVVPVGQTAIAAGDTVLVMLVGSILASGA